MVVLDSDDDSVFEVLLLLPELEKHSMEHAAQAEIHADKGSSWILKACYQTSANHGFECIPGLERTLDLPVGMVGSN